MWKCAWKIQIFRSKLRPENEQKLLIRKSEDQRKLGLGIRASVKLGIRYVVTYFKICLKRYSINKNARDSAPQISIKFIYRPFVQYIVLLCTSIKFVEIHDLTIFHEHIIKCCLKLVVWVRNQVFIAAMSNETFNKTRAWKHVIYSTDSLKCDSKIVF